MIDTYLNNIQFILIMIDGVVITEIKRYSDERGWLSEIYRRDDNGFQVQMSYVSFTNHGIVRGPHEHKSQSDFFVFIGPGDFELHLWDNRKDSKTKGEHVKMILGESKPASVLIPPGVVHGYKSISKDGSCSLNLPDSLYKGEGKKSEVDEIRHENDPKSRFQITKDCPSQ